MVNELTRMRKLECLIGKTSNYNSKYFLLDFTSEYVDYFGEDYYDGFGYTIFLMENEKLNPVFDFEVGGSNETHLDFKKGISFLQNKGVNRVYTIKSEEYGFEFDYAFRNIGPTYEKSYKKLDDFEVQLLKEFGIELIEIEQSPDFDVEFRELRRKLGILSSSQKGLDDF